MAAVGLSANQARAFIVLIAALVLSSRAFAQVSPEEHAKHHPNGQEAATQDSGTDKPGMMGGEGGGMMGGQGGGMGAMMGASPAKELYPALMELDDMPLEERATVRARAHDRMKSGTVRLSAGLKRLAEEAPGDDFAGMQDALGEMREGMAEFESGLAAHRALVEGSSPKSVALQWFKREMNLLEGPVPGGSTGPFGLSWFHFWSMSLLTGFAAAMIGMYFFKMRRATAVLQHIVATSPAEDAPAPSPTGAAPAAVPAVSAAPPASATTAATPAAAPAAVTGPWSGRLRVACILPETPEIKTFRFMSPDGAPIPFRFRPGQFLTLAVTAGGKPVKRSYTIASSPTVADYIDITVKREPEGIVSRHLHDEIHDGDLVEVKGPSGKFIFTGEESDSLVLIGGGVGITPLMSVIRYLTDRAWPGRITLLYGCRTPAEFVFRDELETRQRRHPNLQVVATMSRESGPEWTGAVGRLSRELIAATVPDIARHRVHVCGPSGLMEAVTAMLGDLGVPAENVKTEAFGPARKPGAAPPSNPIADPDAAANAPPDARPTAPTEAAEVEFRRSGKAAPLSDGSTVLDVADDLGVDIDNSCRTGICGTCKVKLLEGEVQMDVEDGLEPGDREAGFILACQATSKGNVAVDA